MNELKTRLDRFEGQDPICERLDHYEALAKSLLKEKDSAKLQRVLNMAAFVRDHLKRNDAEGAAMFMFRFAVAIHRANLSFAGEKRKGYKKDRRWLDIVIRKVMEKKPGASRPLLWNHLKVNYNVRENKMELKENGVFGDVYWQNDSLIFDDSDALDIIKEDTFLKAVSQFKKNM